MRRVYHSTADVILPKPSLAKLTSTGQDGSGRRCRFPTCVEFRLYLAYTSKLLPCLHSTMMEVRFHVSGRKFFVVQPLSAGQRSLLVYFRYWIAAKTCILLRVTSKPIWPSNASLYILPTYCPTCNSVYLGLYIVKFLLFRRISYWDSV